MELSIVSDEISKDLEEALQLGTSWGIKNYELRNIGGERIPDISTLQIESILHLFEKYKATITYLSPGTFKCSLDEDLSEHFDKLEKTFTLMDKLGAKGIITFGIRKTPSFNYEEGFQKAAAIMQKVAEMAAGREQVIILENEAGWYADTEENTARMLKIINSPYLQLNWDPGNSQAAGGKPEENYNLISQWVRNVHIKDCFYDKTSGAHKWVPIGQGDINYLSIIKKLYKNGYRNYITIETHYSPKIEGSYDCYKKISEMLQQVRQEEET